MNSYFEWHSVNMMKNNKKKENKLFISCKKKKKNEKLVCSFMFIMLEF